MLIGATFFNRGVLLTCIMFLKSKTIYTLTLQIVTKTNKQKQMSLTAVVDKGKIEKQIKIKSTRMYMCYQDKRGNPLAAECPPDIFPISITGSFQRIIRLKMQLFVIYNMYTKFHQR